MIDPSNFMSLDKVEREPGLADISILIYSPEVLLDCTPMEPSYVWMGTGITDRDLRRMPNFGLLLFRAISRSNYDIFATILENAHIYWLVFQYLSIFSFNILRIAHPLFLNLDHQHISQISILFK